jgi:hypothetical protein
MERGVVSDRQDKRCTGNIAGRGVDFTIVLTSIGMHL